MPVYQLHNKLIFPPPEKAESSGLLAVGGDLSLKRLLLAYSMGIFPWYTEGDPILWWSPDPRLILDPADLKVSKSLKRIIRKGPFSVTIDRAFDLVIKKCANIERSNDPGTWITDDMTAAYTELHRNGFAHSVETWSGNDLCGGLYGVSIGRSFFGESMFSSQSNASKIAFVHLVCALKKWGFGFIDCQVRTAHLLSMGAREIPRSEFLERLGNAISFETQRGKWSLPKNLELLL